MTTKISNWYKMLAMGEADFNQFIRLMNQLVIAAEKPGREENLSLVLLPTMTKDMDEELNPVYRIVDILHRPTKKMSVTMLW